jgi:hypothetical protein
VIAMHALDANAAGRTHRYDSMPPLRERLAASHAATALSTLFRYRARSRPDPDANVSLRPTTYFGEPFAAAQTSSIDSTTAARNSARPQGIRREHRAADRSPSAKHRIAPVCRPR